jgi:hypothetical protein
LDFAHLAQEHDKVKNMLDKNKCCDIFFDLEKTLAKKNP